jgi:GT2 family glycosyltransferase/glycosyltransferase involved in cell wall biosynthesis
MSETEPPTQPPTPEPLRRFSLRERLVLTYRNHGGRSLAYRLIMFPLRFTPLRDRARHRRGARPDGVARGWYRREGRPVTIVIPSYRDAARVKQLVKSIRATSDPSRVRIVVTDDASGPEHVAKLRQIQGVTIIEGGVNAGFAANVNRGIKAADPTADVVILNSDTLARRGWLAALQYTASLADDIGIVGAKLLYEDGRIQFGGTVRHPDHPEWFDHRFRFMPRSWGPAAITQPVLAVTGACMYIRRELIDEIGLFDEAFPMAYEDVDYCLRAWQSGYRVFYSPAAEFVHLESVTRGWGVREPERESQRVFWSRWGTFFDAREVRTPDGRLRVIYVTEDTGVGGGHRDVFEHLNGLLDRGHDVELWTLAGPPVWFDLRAPIRTFESYPALVEALAPVDAIKIATWWNTAAAVWDGSVLHGIPVYFVQDIETSYYPNSAEMRHRVLASYRHEFRYMTISSWNQARLEELGLRSALIPPGIDLDNFRPLPAATRRQDMILALGRSNPLKNLGLTLEAWRRLPTPRPELCLFGIEPQLASEPGIRYVTSPSDDEVNELLNSATVFVQTSVHEGFCLPPLEAMATGAAVVCTDAHGNRDFCIDGHNCLMPAADAGEVAQALSRLLSDEDLRQRLGREGIDTAAAYAWSARLDALERFLLDVAEPRSVSPSTDAVPQPRATPRR